MKSLKFTLIAVAITALVSCGGGSANHEATAEGFSEIEKDLKSKFGENAYYTDLSVIYDESIGNMISTTVTDDPESLTMGEWSQSQGTWQQTSEVSLEIPPGTKAADFMFQLGNEVSLKKLGELIEKSKAQLTEEKGLENPALDMAYINYPDNGDISKAQYCVQLEPETGGTSFSFYYTLGGEFIDMNY